MTYLTFHLVFILPPLAVLAVLAWPHIRGFRRVLAIVALPPIALLYTTPWDNYLVASEVWWYGPDRVLGTIGYVPVEEYAFFLLQPLLTGLLVLVLLGRSGSAAPGEAGERSSRRVRVVGALLYLAVAAVGGVALGYESGTYLGLILVWAAPVLAGQWAWAGAEIWRRRRPLGVAVALPTVYLWGADAVAIHEGIWTISERFTTGLALGILPIEEATFFLVTNLLVVQGMILFLHPPARAGVGADAGAAVGPAGTS